MSNQQQPDFTTKRLKLIPLANEHLPVGIELDTDPKVTRYLFRHPRTVSEVQERFPRRVQKAEDAPGYGYWLGMLNSEPIGWFVLLPPDRDDQGPSTGQAELGYRLLPKFWRRGFATEGSQALMRYAFVELKLERVFAETMAVNAASRATMAKLGMNHTRSFRMEFDDVVEGSEEGEVEYAITREQWQQLH